MMNFDNWSVERGNECLLLLPLFAGLSLLVSSRSRMLAFLSSALMLHISVFI